MRLAREPALDVRQPLAESCTDEGAEPAAGGKPPTGEDDRARQQAQAGRDGRLFAATGNTGKVYEIGPGLDCIVPAGLLAPSP